MGLVNTTVYSKSLHTLKLYYITKKLHRDVHYIIILYIFVILIISAHGYVLSSVKYYNFGNFT
jgi:hypothetical protein